MSAMPEQVCPRCGAGMLTGHEYPSCADFPTPETRVEAHRLFCRNFAEKVCEPCAKVLDDDHGAEGAA